jgi:bacterioferritin-associated ferredoxin
MYVCICNAITDREIRSAADLGARTLDDLSSTLGVATCCRRCADCATCVLNDHLTATQEAATPKMPTQRATFERAASDRTSIERAFGQHAAQGAD